MNIEDSPFFATEEGRCESTFAWVDEFKTIHEFLNQEEEKSYSRFYLKRSYLQKFFGKEGWNKLVSTPSERYMIKHPGQKLHIWFLPPSINKGFDLRRCIQEGTGDYDLRFGDTFYDGSWFENFDQAGILGKVQCPSVLMHTAVKFDDKGILLGAMSGDDARRAHSLLVNNKLIDDIKTGHDIHDEKPDYFVKVMEDFLKRINEN